MPDLTELVDDPAIVDSDLVYRRIAWAMLGDQSGTEVGSVPQLTGNCFQDYKEEKAAEYGFAGPCMSVALGSVLKSLGLPPSTVLEDHPDHGLAVISVGGLRQLVKSTGEPCPQGVLASATDKEPWHAVVFEAAQPTRSKAARKAIAASAEWEIALRNPQGS